MSEQTQSIKVTGFHRTNARVADKGFTLTIANYPNWSVQFTGEISHDAQMFFNELSKEAGFLAEYVKDELEKNHE